MGMSKSAVEQGDPSGTMKLLSPLQEVKIPTKGVGEEYFTTQAVLPFSPEPVKLSFGFKADSLTLINVQISDEAVEDKIREELQAKYGPPKAENRCRDEQCIYRNGNSFTLKSGVQAMGWRDDETSTTPS